MAIEFPELFENWDKYIIVLQVDDHGGLLNLAMAADFHDQDNVAFQEPDLDNDLTAIAIMPTCNFAKKYLSPLQLSRKGVKHD